MAVVCHFQRGACVHRHCTPEEPAGPYTACSEQLFAIRGPAARARGPELLGSRWVEIQPGELGGVPFCLEPGQQDRVCAGPQD